MPVPIPYPGRPGQYAGLRGVEVRADIDEVYGHGAFDLRAMFAEALRRGLLEMDEVARRFALAYEQLTQGSRNQLANVHHDVGLQMQSAVLAAYEEARITRGRDVEPYRKSTRDAGGRLLAALASPQFFRGTYDGIGFANITHLDRSARQWARLNFGAMPAAGARPRQYRVTWRGMAIAAVGLTDYEPSRPFMLPAGFWSEGTFGPTGRTPTFPARGIRAWNFLDAGVETFSRAIGPAYERLNDRWMESARRGLGPLSRVVEVPGRATRPPPPRVG